MIGNDPILKHLKSPSELKHDAFNNEVVALIKTGLGGRTATTRAELVAQEALVVLGRLNRLVTKGYLPRLEAPVPTHNEDGTIHEYNKYLLDRRHCTLAATVEYYMVQAGLIRPSVIVQKVRESIGRVTVFGVTDTLLPAGSGGHLSLRPDHSCEGIVMY